MTDIEKLKRQLEAAASVVHKVIEDPGPYSYCLVIMSEHNAWYTFSACSPAHQTEIDRIRGLPNAHNKPLQASSAGPSSSGSGPASAADSRDKGPSR